MYWSLLKFLDLVGVSFRRLRGSWILISALGKRRGLKEEKGTVSVVGELSRIYSVPLLSCLVQMADCNSSCSKCCPQAISQGRGTSAAYVGTCILKLCTHILAYYITGVI